MKFHEFSNIFPMMSKEEYSALKADIQENGLREAIWIYDDKILDGRNRFTACEELGIKPRFRTWTGTGSLVDFVVSLNLHRRHLNSSQKGTCSAEAGAVTERLRIEAEERQREHAGTAPGVQKPKDETLVQIVGQVKPAPLPKRDHAGDADAQAAKLFHTNRQYVSDARRIKETAPEKFAEIKAGKKTIPQVMKEIKQEQRKALPKPELPRDVYDVILADCPWQYSNSGFNESAESQYPTMALPDICKMPVISLCAPNAVLFLWAVNPLLPEALEVMKAWGFEYVTNICWVKDKGRGKGWWLKSKHELLLIGRKDKTEQPEERPDSCFMADRGNTHSRKPEEAFAIIEAMYPKGKYLELFARTKREKWTAWGNQV